MLQADKGTLGMGVQKMIGWRFRFNFQFSRVDSGWLGISPMIHTQTCDMTLCHVMNNNGAECER